MPEPRDLKSGLPASLMPEPSWYEPRFSRFIALTLPNVLPRGIPQTNHKSQKLKLELHCWMDKGLLRARSTYGLRMFTTVMFPTEFLERFLSKSDLRGEAALAYSPCLAYPCTFPLIVSMVLRRFTPDVAS